MNADWYYETLPSGHVLHIARNVIGHIHMQTVRQYIFGGSNVFLIFDSIEI